MNAILKRESGKEKQRQFYVYILLLTICSAATNQARETGVCREFGLSQSSGSKFVKVVKCVEVVWRLSNSSGSECENSTIGNKTDMTSLNTGKREMNVLNELEKANELKNFHKHFDSEGSDCYNVCCCCKEWLLDKSKL